MTSAYLITLAIYIIIGGGARFFKISYLPSQVNFGEIIVFAMAIVTGVTNFRDLLRNKSFIVLLLFIVNISFLMGLLKHGFDNVAFIYSIRLSLQLIAGWVGGGCLYKRFRSDIIQLNIVVVKVYGILACISIFIFLKYPQSTELWKALDENGIQFDGDPHVGRLVSTYFDPNIYSSIAVYPLTLGLISIIGLKGAKVAKLSLVLIFVSIILTYSRSGLSSLFLMVLFLLVDRGVRQIIFRLKYIAGILFLLFVVLGLGSAIGAGVDESIFERIERKFTDVSEDESALARLTSYKVGEKLFLEEPILGFGYNYGLVAAVKIKGNGIDSSLQVIIISLGLIGSSLVFGIFFGFESALRKRLIINSGKEVRLGYSCFIGNLLIAVFWSGNFNQIVFFQFWIVPVAAIGFYFYNVGYKNKIVR